MMFATENQINGNGKDTAAAAVDDYDDDSGAGGCNDV